MLNDAERKVLRDFLIKEATGKSTDTRALIQKAIQSLTSMSLATQHVAGTLSGLKRNSSSGAKFSVIHPGRETFVRIEI